MLHALLAITIAAQFVLLVCLAISIWRPARRVWPPPSRNSWQFYVTWFLSWVGLSGVFLLAVLDENSLGWPVWLRLGAGIPLLLLGAVCLFWSFRSLSPHTTLGLPGPLIRDGPYRWSRNPQYLGSCVYMASLVLLSGSAFTALGCSAVALWFLAAPFSEEPWLRERFGAAYEAYCREVPRFFTLRRPSASA
jgi:protein-S-isoprenylcysteine O-methyltransferase Ste14